MASLLAVDLGLRTGLALYGSDGRLIWYRSQHYGNRSQLRRAIHGLLATIPELAWLVIEGGGPIAELWVHEGQRRGLSVRLISAEDWRERLHLRDSKSRDWKERADELARRVIAWSEARRPTSLRHDAAEAILIGLWGVLEAGWLDRLPEELGH